MTLYCRWCGMDWTGIKYFWCPWCKALDGLLTLRQAARLTLLRMFPMCPRDWFERLVPCGESVYLCAVCGEAFQFFNIQGESYGLRALRPPG